MTTLMQAVERTREMRQWPPVGDTSMRYLLGDVRPAHRDSLRSLIATMRTRSATPRRWAVILCRFADQAPDSVVEGAVEKFYRDAFNVAPDMSSTGSGGFIAYWRDTSLGAIDVAGSRVFGWVTVKMRRSEASGAGRSGLVDAAIAAVKRDSADPETGFHSQMSIYTHNWSVPGAPAGATGATPGWSDKWIDGGADGRGKVSLTPPHNGSIAAHEMGHSFGMQHDVGPAMTTDDDYGDPCCVMSASDGRPGWRGRPTTVCLPHLLQQGWMYQRRIFYDAGGWTAEPGGVEFDLAPTSQPGAAAWLGARLANDIDPEWEYLIELVTPGDWNRDLPALPAIMVRRIAPVQVGSTVQLRPTLLQQITIPGGGPPKPYKEPSGNATFTVSMTERPGPIVHVTVRR